MFTTVASAASLVEAGQLRAIAVTSTERSPAFPQLPTVSEGGIPGYTVESWYGLFARGKNATRYHRLNKSAAKAVQSEAFKRLAELDRYFHSEEGRWRKVIEEAGIKAE